MKTGKILNYIDILRAIRGAPTSPTEIAEACSSSRSTIRRFLADCEEWSLVRQADEGYALTAAGYLIVREYEDLEDEKQAGLAFLANSEHGLDLLRIIATQPADRAELAERSGASRSTVQRHMSDFQGFGEDGWTIKQNGTIELSSGGDEIIETYDSFTVTISIIEDKIPFLERYEGAGEEISIEALKESRMVVSTAGDRQKVVREVNSLDPGDVEPLRGISHAFSAEISDQYWSIVSPDTECELIIDRKVYKAITHPKGWKHLFKALRRPKFRILVYPENLTVGVFHFDDEQAGIAAYNEKNPLDVGLYGDNEALIEWAKNIYEKHHERATSPAEDLFKWAVRD